MQGDIYATKGIEYLIVIGYLVVMAALVGGLALRRRARRAAAPARRGRAAGAVQWFTLASDCSFHPGHAWVARRDGSVVTVGLDDFAAKLLGDPRVIELPAVGAAVRQGETVWTVRAGERALPMLSPVEGEVVAVNPAVLASPGLASADPYGEGWLLKVRVPEHRAWLRNLLSGELAAAWMQHTTERVRRFESDGLGAVMADGGTPLRGFGHALSQEEWESVSREFFLAG